MLTFHTENPSIKNNFKIFEANPFPIIHWVNDTLCYYNYVGEKFIIFEETSGCVWPLITSSDMNLANGPTTFELASSEGECESMVEDAQHPKYNIDKCIPKSKLHNAVKIWPRIEHEKDFVYIYCWNQTLKYANFSRKCENSIYKLPKDLPFFLDGHLYNNLKSILVKNLTSSFISSKINSQIFVNHSEAIGNVETILLHAKLINQNIDPVYQWGSWGSWLGWFSSISDWVSNLFSYSIIFFNVILLLIICILLLFLCKFYKKIHNLCFKEKVSF